MTIERDRFEEKVLIESMGSWHQQVIRIGDIIWYKYRDPEETGPVQAVYEGIGVAFGQLSLVCRPIDNPSGGESWENFEEIIIPGFEDRETTLELNVGEEGGWLFFSSDHENITAIKLGRRRIKSTQIPIHELPMFSSSSNEESH